MADDKTDANNQRGKGNKPSQQAEGTTQKELLSDIKDTLVAQSQGVGESLGRDTVNIRRHLLEMKKMNIEQIEHMKALNDGFGIQADLQEKKSDSESVTKANDAEESEDLKSIFVGIRESLDNLPGSLAQDGAKANGSVMGDMMSGIGGAFGGIGIGVGAAGLGAAAVIGAGAYLLNVLDDIDAEKIKENVTALLSISDVVEADGDSFIGEGGAFFLAMTGLGIGLAAFSIGAGAAAAVDYFTKDSGWAENIKENVLTLLSISDGFVGNLAVLGESGTLLLSLTGLGIGLAAFGIGSTVAGVGGAINKFISGDNWAQNIKDEVLTLLSIGDAGGGNLEVLGESGALFLALTGLGLGLAAFAFGKTASGVGDAVTMFQGENFADDIKSEVETLLSISQIEGIGFDTAKFIAVMGGLGSGLLAFGAGKGIAGVADITTQFGGKNFAEDIKSEVATLLTIGDLPGATLEKTTESMAVLSALGTGLAAFGAGSFVGALGQLGAEIVGFFTGAESPVKQAQILGENAEEIDKGVASLESFREVLESFTGLEDVSFNINTQELAEDLLDASKAFELALVGGTDPNGLFGRAVELKGLVNIDGIEQTVTNINALKQALFQIPSTTGVDINTGSLANQIANNQPAGANVNQVRGGDSNTTSVRTNIVSNPTDPTYDSLIN